LLQYFFTSAEHLAIIWRPLFRGKRSYEQYVWRDIRNYSIDTLQTIPRPALRHKIRRYRPYSHKVAELNSNPVTGFIKVELRSATNVV